MKMHKKAAESQGYTLSYDRTTKAYKAEKRGYVSLFWSKHELETIPVYRLIMQLMGNNQE